MYIWWNITKQNKTIKWYLFIQLKKKIFYWIDYLKVISQVWIKPVNIQLWLPAVKPRPVLIVMMSGFSGSDMARRFPEPRWKGSLLCLPCGSCHGDKSSSLLRLCWPPAWRWWRSTTFASPSRWRPVLQSLLEPSGSAGPPEGEKINECRRITFGTMWFRSSRKKTKIPRSNGRNSRHGSTIDGAEENRFACVLEECPHPSHGG